MTERQNALFRATAGILCVLPGAAYFAVMLLGIAFGITAPVDFLVGTLLAPNWTELVFYGLVLGGPLVSAMLSLQENDMKRQGCAIRALGWTAIVLLVCNMPMSIFSFHRLLARNW